MNTLHRNLIQNIHLTYYLNHIVPIVVIIIMLICFIIFTAYLYKDSKYDYTTLSKRTACYLLLHSIAVGFCYTICSGLLLSLIMSCGNNITSRHTVTTIKTAITYQKTDLPKLKNRVKSNDREYSRINYPTKLERQMEPTYHNALEHKVHYDQHVIDKAKLMDIHWYYYL